MRKILILAALLGAYGAGAAMTAKVSWTQRWPWNTKVDIDFALSGGAKCDVAVTASFTTNGVPGTVDLERAGAKGDFWELEPGMYHLEWDPAAAGLDGTALKDFAVQVTPVEDAANARKWLVIDLKDGTWEYAADEPTGGWNQDMYKQGKMVFRRIPAGTFTRGYTDAEKAYLKGLDAELGLASSKMLTAKEVTLTSDYYISIYQTTRAQVARIMDVPSSNGYYNQVTPDAGQMFAAGHVCFQRGSNSVEGINWPFTKFAVTPTSIIGRFRARCGNRFWIDLPTCAQWQRAARPDTKWLFYDTSSYPGGMSGGEVGDSLDTITNIIARISFGYQRKYCGVGGVYSPPTTVGDLLPNAYGLYDLIGSRPDLLLDRWNNGSEDAADSAGVDPVGMLDAGNSRMVNNSFSNYGTISNWSIAFAGYLGSDNPRNSNNENCYRYVIHLNPPQSFGGKWVNDTE